MRREQKQKEIYDGYEKTTGKEDSYKNQGQKEGRKED